MKDRWVSLNGQLCLEQEACVPISDRGFLFGEGMFTTIRVSEGKCELFPWHLRRLQQQARALELPVATPSIESIEELIARNHAFQNVWRLKIVVTANTVLATLEPFAAPTEPCTLCLYPTPVERPTAHIKSLSYLDQLFVRIYAHQQGFTDAVMTNGNGYLLETGCSNLFWVDQGALFFPHVDLPYLKGVFLQALLQALPLPTEQVKASLDDVPCTAAFFICNALTHARPVLSIGARYFARDQHVESILNAATERALQEI